MDNEIETDVIQTLDTTESKIVQDELNEDSISILQVDTNNSIVIVSGVQDAYLDFSNNAIIQTEMNTIVVENVNEVSAFDGSTQPTEDDNIVIIDQNIVSLYANDSTTHEFSTENTIVTISDTEIHVDLNETEKTERLLSNKVPPQSPPSVVNAWETCDVVVGNWFHADWFGYFFKMPNNNWIYHETFGWMYAEFTSTFDSFWVYHEILGWQWSSKNSFPYVYNSHKDSWLYLADGYHYDFTRSSWSITD